MKKFALFTVLLVFAAFSVSDAYAQGADQLKGTYNFSTSGTALLADVGGSNCMVANGSVPAALSGGIIIFDGRGGITGSGTAVGISIGATSCTSSNYYLSGSYTITDVGEKHLEATGTLSTNFQGRSAACNGTTLASVPFTIVADLADHSFTISTSGAGSGSTYAEGPAAGPVSCTATIANFVTSGNGSRF